MNKVRVNLSLEVGSTSDVETIPIGIYFIAPRSSEKGFTLTIIPGPRAKV